MRETREVMDRVLAGRYRLLDRLGVGGMSVVWRAHDEVLDREVAVKVLSPGPSINPELLDRIRIEARSAARLRHPNIVEVHDFGETDEQLPYMVLELVDGRSLAEVLSGGAVAWRSAVLIAAQVAAALAAAHARGVVHRDVKPSNVMVTTDGVKLVDFGISATVGEADGIGGEVYGTPAYLAPERLGGGIVRPATDVYALGLLLYLALAGHLPWRASTTTEMLTAHRYLDPAGLPPVDGLPREVADLCRRCLSKNPADRPSAAAAARVLGDVAGLVPATDLLAVLDAPTAVIAVPRHRRRPLVVAAGAALLMIVGGVVWFGGRAGSGDVKALSDRASATRRDVQGGVRDPQRHRRPGVHRGHRHRFRRREMAAQFRVAGRAETAPRLESRLGTGRPVRPGDRHRPARHDRLRLELSEGHHAARAVPAERDGLPGPDVGRRPLRAADHRRRRREARRETRCAAAPAKARAGEARQGQGKPKGRTQGQAQAVELGRCQAGRPHRA